VFFGASDGIFASVDDFKDSVCHWTFGDPGSGTYATNGKSKNEAYGKVAAHLFTQAGEYTVTLTATHNGATGQESVVISVSDPDVYYAGTSTVCVSVSGNFTDCPAGAQRITTGDFDLDDGGVLS
jgi:PKD repeat protein